jgi:2-keto-4-pentenoate hydratase
MTGIPESLSALVDKLADAHRGGPAVDDQAAQPLVTSLDDAYAVQEQLYAALGNPAGVAPFWKTGGPTRNDAMRHAPLPVAGVRKSGNNLDRVPLRNRWIEAEVALGLARAVTPEMARDLAHEDARALVGAMCVSIELVDTRWAAGRAAAPLLKVADLVVHGALVLGEPVPFEARAWDQQACRVRIGGGDWQEFRGSLGVGDPLWVLPHWLRHVTRNGATVPAGTIATTGTWCGLLEAAAGDLVVVEFPGIGSASVQL